MTIELTVKLDTDAVETAIREAWQREFRSPDPYSREAKGGAGWQEVMRQVQVHIRTLDVSDMIAALAKARLESIVDEAVTSALREMVKKKAKEMARNGTLLGDKDAEQS